MTDSEDSHTHPQGLFVFIGQPANVRRYACTWEENGASVMEQLVEREYDHVSGNKCLNQDGSLVVHLAPISYVPRAEGHVLGSSLENYKDKHTSSREKVVEEGIFMQLLEHIMSGEATEFDLKWGHILKKACSPRPGLFKVHMLENGFLFETGSFLPSTPQTDRLYPVPQYSSYENYNSSWAISLDMKTVLDEFNKKRSILQNASAGSTPELRLYMWFHLVHCWYKVTENQLWQYEELCRIADNLEASYCTPQFDQAIPLQDFTYKLEKIYAYIFALVTSLGLRSYLPIPLSELPAPQLAVSADIVTWPAVALPGFRNSDYVSQVQLVRDHGELPKTSPAPWYPPGEAPDAPDMYSEPQATTKAARVALLNKSRKALNLLAFVARAKFGDEVNRLVRKEEAMSPGQTQREAKMAVAQALRVVYKDFEKQGRLTSYAVSKLLGR